MPISLSSHKVRASMAVIDPTSIPEFLPPSQSPCRDLVPPSHTSWRPRESIPPPGTVCRRFSATGGTAATSAASAFTFSYASSGQSGTWGALTSLGGGPRGTFVPFGVHLTSSQSSGGGGGGVPPPAVTSLQPDPQVRSLSSISWSFCFSLKFSSCSCLTTSLSKSRSSSSCTLVLCGKGPSVRLPNPLDSSSPVSSTGMAPEVLAPRSSSPKGCWEVQLAGVLKTLLPSFSSSRSATIDRRCRCSLELALTVLPRRSSPTSCSSPSSSASRGTGRSTGLTCISSSSPLARIDQKGLCWTGGIDLDLATRSDTAIAKSALRVALGS